MASVTLATTADFRLEYKITPSLSKVLKQDPVIQVPYLASILHALGAPTKLVTVEASHKNLVKLLNLAQEQEDILIRVMLYHNMVQMAAEIYTGTSNTQGFKSLIKDILLEIPRETAIGDTLYNQLNTNLIPLLMASYQDLNQALANPKLR